MKEMARLGLVLFIVASISALVLSYTNQITEPLIAQKSEEAAKKSRQTVLPEATEFKKIEGADLGSDIVSELYEGYGGSELKGYVARTLPVGYSGPVEVIVGLNLDGSISGVSIGNHKETPGLGSKASGEFKDQYTGMNTNEPIGVIKSGQPKENEVVAISGATITSRAVTTGINEAAKAVLEMNK